MKDYDTRCVEAATVQGLDAATDVLREHKIEHVVEQSGGFTMVVRINVTDGVLIVTSSEVGSSRQYDVGYYLEDDWEMGSEELRVHDALDPIDLLKLVKFYTRKDA